MLRRGLRVLTVAVVLAGAAAASATATFRGRPGAIAYNYAFCAANSGHDCTQNGYALATVRPPRSARIRQSCLGAFDENAAADITAPGSGAAGSGECTGFGRVGYSPDGRRIVYDANGHMEVASSTGGQRFQFRDTPSSQPSFSPDGRRLVFVAGVQPSAALIGLQRAGNVQAAIFTAALDGSHRSRVTASRPGATPMSGREPVFSPSGREILFVHNRTVWEIPAGGGRASVLLPNADHPDFSPNGRRVVYIHDHQVWLARADGTYRHALRVNYPKSEISPEEVDEAVFSPDGRHIAIGGIAYNDNLDAAVWVAPSGGGVATQVAGDDTPDGGTLFGLAWQPVP